MSFKNFKEYVDKYLDKEFVLTDLDKYDGDADAFLCLEVLQKRTDVLYKKEVSDALVDAIKRTPAYRKIKWDESKKELEGKLTSLEIRALVVARWYLKVKEVFNFHFNAWKLALMIFQHKNNPFPLASIPDLNPDDAGLIKFLGRQDWIDSPEKTVVVEANIEQHGTGRVASAAYGQEIELMDEVKIVSYNVVPGKVLREVEGEAYIRPEGGFSLEGQLPAEPVSLPY